ncbi:MAG: SDR family NAD(P)-dependent oxidoreductase, partial [Proteobacteria bacterium]|nr:SDR family NAD(P)-dependent oxidoreductase [Pseudomonadota bacterium]
PSEEAWRLDLPERGSLQHLRGIEAGEALAPLAAGEVRVEVRASGINFRDVLNALGMVPAPWLGLEVSGVVVEVGEGVTSLSVGQRVLGLGRATFATLATADARLLTPTPAGLTDVEAATVPLVFLTALYGLQDLGSLQSGERVLVHAAAGGVGMAAVQLAQHWGVEVFGTASPGKWPALEAMGLAEDHMASSRDTDFADAFLAATSGEGVDVVLNALAGEFVDASLRLLPRGGRFLEMGKTDIRDASEVAEAHAGVAYQAFDLMEAGPARIGSMLSELGALFESGVLCPLPLSATDLRHAPVVFKHMANARHVGKLVLVPPRALESDGTVLVTGGLGELGQALSRHLVAVHGVRHLVLTSRRGEKTPGSEVLVAELASLGAETVTVAACDVSDREAVAAVLDTLETDHPLTGVFHLAGVLDDGVVTELTAERVARVLAPKVDGAWHLHTLTAGHDLSAFVLFSSAAGVMGGPGQANYAAANTFLDALAASRRQQGLAGQSLAWGLWEQQGVGMTAHLGAAELTRMSRQGLSPLSVSQGMALLDASMAHPDATLVPVRMDLARMQRGLPESTAVPALLRRLLRPGLRRVGAAAVTATALRQRLSALPESEREAALVTLVQEEV